MIGGYVCHLVASLDDDWSCRGDNDDVVGSRSKRLGVHLTDYLHSSGPPRSLSVIAEAVV